MMVMHPRQATTTVLRAIALLPLCVFASCCTVTRYSYTPDDEGSYQYEYPSGPVYIYRGGDEESRFRHTHPRRDRWRPDRSKVGGHFGKEQARQISKHRLQDRGEWRRRHQHDLKGRRLPVQDHRYYERKRPGKSGGVRSKRH